MKQLYVFQSRKCAETGENDGGIARKAPQLIESGKFEIYRY